MAIKPQIGLEIHAQLLTKTKAFCSCSSESFDAPPNTHICDGCTGQPGTLPKLNATVVEFAVKAALAAKFEGALHCERIELLLEGILPSLDDVDATLPAAALLDAAVEANVRRTVRQLRASPEGRAELASGAMKLVGAVYDLDTGRVRFLE